MARSVRAGALAIWVDGTRATAGPGDALAAAPDVPHRFRNESGAPVEVDVEIWPALRTRELFEILFALDRAGRLNRLGAPDPLRLGLLTRDFGDQIFLMAAFPAQLQLAVGRLLGAAARRLGTSLVAS